MCGICGIVDFERPVEDGAARVAAMNETLRHRGPDDDGSLVRPHAALAMRRLSVIDLEGGRQPIASEDGKRHIFYNGETYNFLELRDNLVAKGHVFTSRTDTESVLHHFEEYGADGLARLNGMFAFAVLDEKNNRLTLARDHVGIKPLYYCARGTRLYFGSEIKALLTHPDVPRDLDLTALTHYLAHLYVPSERTIFKHIRRLPPGHYLVHDKNGADEPVAYWKLPEETRHITEDQAAEELLELLSIAVRQQLVSDVPLGAFLSGGVDSSVVVALMARAGGRVETFSIGFKEPGFDERPFARRVAEHCGAEHHEFVLDYPGIAEFLPQLVRMFDQPFADASAIPAFLLAREARRHVTVALSGNGGDELFGGYDKYRAESLNRYLMLAPAAARRAVLKRFESARESADLGDRNRRIRRMLEYSLEPPDRRPVSWTTGFGVADQKRLFRPEVAAALDLENIFEPWTRAFNSAPALDAVSRQMRADIGVYLPDNNLLKDDITGMAASLEARVPLLDRRVVEFAAALPPGLKIRGNELKYILKKVARTLVPAEVIDRPKQGFTVPVGRWINGELAGFADDALDPAAEPFDEYFNPKEMHALLEQHRKGRADNAMRLWALMILRVWHHEFIKKNA